MPTKEYRVCQKEFCDCDNKLISVALSTHFKSHVLQEVSHAIVGSVLVSGSGVDPEADSGGRCMGPALCRNADPIVQHRQVGRWRVHLRRDRRRHHPRSLLSGLSPGQVPPRRGESPHHLGRRHLPTDAVAQVVPFVVLVGGQLNRLELICGHFYPKDRNLLNSKSADK